MKEIEIRNVRLLPARQSMGLALDQQVWRDRNPHALNARLRTAVKRGEVAVVQRGQKLNKYGQHFVVVRVLKPARSRRGWVLAALVLGTGALVGVGAMVWYSRWVLAASAGVLLFFWFIINSVSKGHPCTGLHCAGCKG